MKRRFDHASKSYKVRKERGERLSHDATDSMLRALLANKDATYMTTGDTLIVVSDGTAYIATVRETVNLEDAP